MIFGMKGTPYIYQGDEIGMTNVIYTESSRYQDIESVNFRKEKQELGWSEEKILSYLLRNSRDNARTPMQWNATENAGFSESTPWIQVEDNYRQINVEAEEQDEDSVLNFYKKLIALRKEMKIISQGKIAFQEEENEAILRYTRTLGDQKLEVLCNLKEEPVEVEWTAGDEFQKVIGNYVGNLDVKDGKITLRAYEFLAV